MKNLQDSIEKLHTTKLGEVRIKKNTGINTENVIDWCKKAVANADIMVENGKNWYVYYNGYALTINSNSYTVITVHKINAKVRLMEKADFVCLEELLYQAIFVKEGEEPPLRSIIKEPQISIYMKDFGQKQGDFGVVAEQNGQIIGAAWTRIIPAYGYIDERTPELIISILPEFRGYGTGTKLINKLFKLLKEKGYKQTSLSVQKANPAFGLYKRMGYKTVKRESTNVEYKDYLMVKTL